MFRFITRQTLTGLVTILPVMLTLYLLYWFVMSTEKALGQLIQFFLPDVTYWPGMGVIAGLLLVFVIGLLMHVYVVQKLFEKAEQLLYHTPLIKSVYGALRDFFHFFSSTKEKDFQQVVAISINPNMELIGFITQHDEKQLPQTLEAEDKVMVYLPMSYMIGGYAVLVPRSAVREIDMSMEEAMRFTLTAGVASNGK